MGIKGMSLLATLAFVLASPGVANAETVRVTGTETEGSGRTCGEFVQIGFMVRGHCEEITNTWAGGISGTSVFDEFISLNIVTGHIQVSGGEFFTNACVDGSCGTLESTWHGSGWLDLETGAVIVIEGEQHFTGGTGDLEGAKGSIRFSLVDEGPATYEGFIVL
jgi:hypothetical protein